MKTEIIRYAHCVKWTLSELDRDPFSRYELRQVEVQIREICDDFTEWEVRQGDSILACEDTIDNALALAAYNLMADSRDMAKHQALEAPKSQIRLPSGKTLFIGCIKPI